MTRASARVASVVPAGWCAPSTGTACVDGAVAAIDLRADFPAGGPASIEGCDVRGWSSFGRIGA
jgi:hypothetical protein